MAARIYLDACALQRPLDILSTTSLRLEAHAVEMLVELVAKDQVELVWSPALDWECIVRSPVARREYAKTVRTLARHHQGISDHVSGVARELVALAHVDPWDAVHAACASAASAVLVTTDQAFLRRLGRVPQFGIEHMDPVRTVSWLRERQGT